MSVSSYIRRQFKNGVAVTDTIPAGLGSGATSFSFASGSTFPDGSVGPFVCTLDQGVVGIEEKILVTTRSGAAASGVIRGYNGTTATNHNPNCTVLHTIDQQDLDEANQVVVQTIGAVQAVGDLLVGSASHALARLARGTSGQFLQTVGTNLQWTGFGSGRSQNVGSTDQDGTDTTPARSDHVHAGVTSFNTRKGAVTLTEADVVATGAVPVPIGGFIDWGSDTLPAAIATEVWLHVAGQTISGGAATYAALAALYPSWVSGSNLVLPDTRNVFIIGAAVGGTGGPAVFTTGGAANVTLLTTHVPQFSAVSVSVTDPGHVHTVPITDPQHAHAGSGATSIVNTALSSSLFLAASGPQAVSFSSTTQAASTGITAAASSHTTGLTGTVTFGQASPTPVPTVPPNLALHKIVRAL